ncbi:MAG: EAL domain-containing protein [Terracidiphilus sp.]
MLIPKSRAWIALLALVFASSVGALCGYLLGRFDLEQSTEGGLVANATRLEGMTDDLMAEARGMLSALQEANLPPCSDAELGRFRQLIYRSINIRDAGRMHDGQLECSADFGHVEMPATQFRPNNILPDGSEIYRDLPPYRIANELSILMRKGDYFIVEDPNTINRWKILNKEYETYTRSNPDNRWARISGLPSRISTDIADHNGHGRVGDTLYGTHCSVQKTFCSVAYASFSAALQANPRHLIFFSVFGSLIGSLVAFAYLLIHWNSRSLANQLRRAIRLDKLHLVYQPIIDLRSGRLVGAEALVRWSDEEGFTVSPEVFVRLAEERGFISELTARVVMHALKDFHKLQDGNPEFQLHINVTASDLVDEKLLPLLDKSLAEAGVPPHSVAIEVTEGSTASKQPAMRAIHSLRERGHSVKIDDFGTGYSSLAYLKDLAVDAIKIDRAFVQTVGTGAVIEGILPQILAMAETLNLNVVIEGIETEEQAQYFREAKMSLTGQGFLFGRPVPVEKFHNQQLTIESTKRTSS